MTVAQTDTLQELITGAQRDLTEIADHVTLSDAFVAWDVEYAASILARAAHKVRWLREQADEGLFA